MTEPDTLFSRRHKIYRVDTDASGIVFPSRVVDFAVKLVNSWFVERVFLERDAPELRAVFASLSCSFLSPMRPTDVLEIRLAGEAAWDDVEATGTLAQQAAQ